MNDRMEGDRPQGTITFGMRLRRAGRITWLVIEHVFDLTVDGLADYVLVMQREAALFLGLALSLIGLLNFENGKNCDGNTADYLTCTRPSTFYYYNWLEIALVVIGVFLITLWLLRRLDRSSQH